MSQTNPELAESLQQFITVWKKIGRPFPLVDQPDRPGLAITWPDTPFPFYNALFLTESLTDARVMQARLHQSEAYMRTRSIGGLFVVCLKILNETAKESWPKILAQKNFAAAIPMTGMAGDILPLEASGHEALRFKRILNDRTIQDFGHLNCVAYDLPVGTSRCLVTEHTLWREHAYGFVAYDGDKPVSTATAIINEDCLFLFLVATAPEERQKGYGEAVVRHALPTAYVATGTRLTVLHATDAGYPLYLRHGYHPTVKFMGCMLQS